ncbi:hypothetical protein QNH98_00480 [Myroides sp. mNGS23_01]|nr:ATP-binding cassette domain-containing protein [Myroides sp. mNGS23_01]WHT39233.1 hypothetical protein QNH98_00480 [Myroides sp. mNGS23_01]
MKDIRVINARQNNLKNLSLTLPKNKITVFTGVSGSGKSSLVFKTIGAEAQRQFNETQDSFTRNRLQHLGIPDVDKIENLNVPILINQKKLGGNARSTIEQLQISTPPSACYIQEWVLLLLVTPTLFLLIIRWACV